MYRCRAFGRSSNEKGTQKDKMEIKETLMRERRPKYGYDSKHTVKLFKMEPKKEMK